MMMTAMILTMMVMMMLVIFVILNVLKPGQPLHKLAVISQCVLRSLHPPLSSSIICVPVAIMVSLKPLLLFVVVVHPHEALLDLLHGDSIGRHVQVRVQLAVVRQQKGVKSLGGLRLAGRICLRQAGRICLRGDESVCLRQAGRICLKWDERICLREEERVCLMWNKRTCLRWDERVCLR